LFSDEHQGISAGRFDFADPKLKRQCHLTVKAIAKNKRRRIFLVAVLYALL